MLVQLVRSLRMLLDNMTFNALNACTKTLKHVQCSTAASYCEFDYHSFNRFKAGTREAKSLQSKCSSIIFKCSVSLLARRVETKRISFSTKCICIGWSEIHTSLRLHDCVIERI